MKEFDENKKLFCYLDENEYNKAHIPRYDFLISDLNLNNINNSTIVDIGCSNGYILKKILSNNNNNNIFGLDFYDYKNLPFKYLKADFDYPFSDLFLTKNNNQKADFAFCFEVSEHIPNLYGFFVQIKEILKPDGILYLSIPHECVTHNTFYPSLFYPVNNFCEFLQQMAFKIEDLRVHNKSFTQNVFILTNKDWSYSKMRWHKNEEKFRNVSPLVSINL